MKIFIPIVFAMIQVSLAADWYDAGIKLNTKQVNITIIILKF